ncbi:hypothetical protein [Flagellimonas aequoris]|uniref:Uncharacterized protein n=1 Tax=Flagellimonas aequoris TaxID=2306997 RepID=A0A418N499_9FLAO|nr:hypothetical protein [Allomuricauda aequoris]RIV68717.1 hypothetical protein D2U88_16135 [Allomuricauda aequoris]
MKVTKKMFSVYLGINPSKIKPYYDDYVKDLGLKRNYLLISDVARLDGVTIRYVSEIMGVKLSCNCDFIPKLKS